jgi:hypothetical protein
MALLVTYGMEAPVLSLTVLPRDILLIQMCKLVSLKGQ